MLALGARVVRGAGGAARARQLQALAGPGPEQAGQVGPGLQARVARVVNVAVIGAPNSGKSTLINNIVGRKVCAASNKVHTTTKLVRAMYVEGDTQIVFLDTPGVVSDRELKKYDLPQSMAEAFYKSLRIADVVGVIHDVSNSICKDSLHPQVLNMLAQSGDTRCFLVLNKVDILKAKRQLLTLIRTLTNGFIAGKTIPGPEVKAPKNFKGPRGYSNFSDVFMVSALHGDGVNDIRNYLISNAKPVANLQYSETEWSDQTPERLIEEAIRAKFLDFLAQEIPYKLMTSLEYYEDMEDKIVCSVSVECPSDRIAKLISGSGGGRLQQIKSHARQDLVNMFLKPVSLDIHLKVKHKPIVR